MVIKYIHVILVILTFLSFSARVFWMYKGSMLLQNKAVKIIPHVIDAMLLLSGLSMAIMYYGAFYKQSWLMLKLLAVIIYIFLGSVGLKYGKSMTIRLIAVTGAGLVFFYIVVLARINAVIPY